MIDNAVNLRRAVIISLPSYRSGVSVVANVAPIPDHLLQPLSTVRLETKPDNADAVSMSTPSDTSHDFARQYLEIFNNPNAYTNFAAVLIKNGNVYCRKDQVNNLSRARYYVQMLREGIGLHINKIMQQEYDTLSLLDRSFTNSSTLIPVLIKHDDSNGCYPAKQYDKYAFPCLTWSIPLHNDDNWCAVSGMPSYKAWRDANSKKARDEKKYWPSTFRKYNEKYPWSDKLNMAVWRGATTFNKGLYGHLDFHDIPRVKLVEMGRKSNLIDAAFHKLVGKYEDTTQTPSYVRQLMGDSIALDEMMKYKGKYISLAVAFIDQIPLLIINPAKTIPSAIIDIDGNAWSARFNNLLCSNSIVIKIQPDFIEQSYNELQPRVHYIPASIGNITEVVKYALNAEYEQEMQQVVKRANEWCGAYMTADALASAAVKTLENYLNMLHDYDSSWNDALLHDFVSNGDLVPCHA
jgi:hypothetical protein